jgi:hypothetical protein
LTLPYLHHIISIVINVKFQEGVIPMRIRAAGILTVLVLLQAGALRAQEFSDENLVTKSENAGILEASFGIGFNYDLLRDPFDVSFQYPEGFFGLNLPLKRTVDLRDYSGYIDPAMDSIFNDTAMFTNGEAFRPTAAARQNPNPTVRVDVPMMGGVASFSSTQNFFINYHNVLGNPSLSLGVSDPEIGLDFFMRGSFNVPLNLTASWETMTFGYAFEVNRYLKLALNLHRHVFIFDMRGKVDIDLLGRYNIEMSGGEDAEESGFDIPTINGELDYSSNRLYGEAYGHYEAEVWSPTIAFKAWRFSVISRFGINTKARGNLYAKYALPFFLDPETFEMKYDLTDPEVLNSSEVRQGLLSNASDSIIYSTRKRVGDTYQESNLIWKMPTGLTIGFDIIPEKIKFSYTKLFGEVAMKLDRIAREQVPLESGDDREETVDSLVIDYGISVDNIMVLEFYLFNTFLNLGIFGFDFRYGEEEDGKNLIGKNAPVNLGRAAMIPILNLGARMGSKMQLLVELDILPLPALKTGVFYYF